MSKKEKLARLDELVLDRMITIMESKDEDQIATLSDLSVPMNYLKNNQMISEKPKSTVEEDTQKRLADAKKRRRENKSQ